MNFSNPILICDENEEFRLMVREMLTKNGFFHVVEASHSEEAIDILRMKRDYFVLIQAGMMDEEISGELKRQKNFIIFADHTDPDTALLTVRVGVERMMDYPIHSKKLIKRLQAIK